DEEERPKAGGRGTATFFPWRWCDVRRRQRREEEGADHDVRVDRRGGREGEGASLLGRARDRLGAAGASAGEAPDLARAEPDGGVTPHLPRVRVRRPGRYTAR